MNQRDLQILLVAALLGAGIYLLLPRKESADLSSHRPEDNQAVLRDIKKSIDRHLKTGRFAEELRRDLTTIENQIKAPAVDPQQIDPMARVLREPLPLRFQAEDAEARAYRDANLNENDSRAQALTPDQRISTKISRDQWEREYRELYAEEYLRTYIENARKAGFDVRLNEKGEIIEVIELGTDEPMRFPSSADESVKKATPESAR